MKTFIAMFIFFVLATAPRLGDAGDMGGNGNNCHQDAISGMHHCLELIYADDWVVPMEEYSGEAKPLPKLAQQLPVKLNKSGACLTPDSILYNRQKKYWLYHSVEQCLRDGGHLDGTVVLRP